MSCGDKIKKARKASNMTQAELAKQCGCATITIRQYESGKREPRQEQLRCISSVLGVGIADLLDQDASLYDGLSKGLISVEDIACELGMPIEYVWHAVHEPEKVDPDIREKVASCGAVLRLESSDPENAHVKTALRDISYSLYKLNELGIQKAVERVSELAEVPKYRRDQERY